MRITLFMCGSVAFPRRVVLVDHVLAVEFDRGSPAGRRKGIGMVHAGGSWDGCVV